MSQTKAQLINAVDGSIVDADIVGLTSSKLSGDLPALSAANLTSIPSANLTGALPAISGASLTNLDAGKVLQVIQDTRTSQVSFTNHSVFTAVSGLFVDITPSAATSKILVTVSITAGTTSNSMFVYRLLRDSTILLPSTGSAVVSGTDYAGTFAGKNDGTRGQPVNFNFLDTPNTTSQVRYSLSVMHNSGTYTLNQRDGNYAGSSTIIAIEVGA
tara:strand:+ start:52 stop:696 length:645 start_codon:yes stop_codon:yes gene_type:complete